MDRISRHRLNPFRQIGLAACLIGLLLFGCASPKLRPSGFLDDYDALQYRKDLSIYYSESSLDLNSLTHVILLRETTWLANDKPDSKLAVELRRVLVERLRHWLLQETGGSVLIIQNESDLTTYRRMPGVGIIVMDPAITRIGKGFGLCRYLIGFRLGDATATIEARTSKTTHSAYGVLNESSQMVAYGRSHGNPHGGLNPRVFSAKYTLRLALDAAARKMARHLAERIALPPKKWWEEMANLSEGWNLYFP